MIGAFVECHQQVAGLLSDPGAAGVGGDAHDVDLPGGQFRGPRTSTHGGQTVCGAFEGAECCRLIRFARGVALWQQFGWRATRGAVGP